MTTHDHPQPPDVLGDLVLACGEFAATAIESLKFELQGRVAAATQYVSVRIGDEPLARLIIQAPNGHRATAYQTDVLPPDLGESAAAFATSAVGRLNEVTRKHLAEVLNGGAMLAVIVSRDEGAASLLVDTGQGPAIPVGTLEPELTKH